MTRLTFVHLLYFTAILSPSASALPSGQTLGAGHGQIPLNGVDRTSSIGLESNNNNAGERLDPFLDVPYPSWLEHQVITCRRDLIHALATARKLGAQTFTSTYPKILQAIKPSAPSIDLAASFSSLEILHKTPLPDAFARAADLLLSGLAGAGGIKRIASNYTCNSLSNENVHRPRSTIYPSAARADGPYDIPEATLRSAIYIPHNFAFGKKTPLIFIPGTGVTGCETFSSNYAKILSSAADPVFLNIPTRMLDDHQDTAEFIAYAINYISSISGGANVSVIAHTGGNMATQWAFKYWPSTRGLVSDYIAISPDFMGTKRTREVCSTESLCPPAIIQQSLGSAFSRTLASNGGHSAYVPTTVVWSIFDEHVTPQQTEKGSTHLQNVHKAGVSSHEIQAVCPMNTPAGKPGPGHQVALYNTHAIAVILDALNHCGPADLKRLKPSCSKQVPDDVEIEDVMRTEAIQPLAVLHINNFASKVAKEPTIKAYAQQDAPKTADV